VVGAEREAVDAHLALVAARCPFLKGKAVDARNGKEDGALTRVFLPDVDPEAFKLVLDYVYTDEIDPTGGKRELAGTNDIVLAILRVSTVAAAFAMTRLEKLCTLYIENAINLTNVLAVMSNASELSLVYIKDYCQRFVTKEQNYNQIVMSRDFEQLDQRLMVEIIRQRQCPQQPGRSLAETSLAEEAAAGPTLKEDLRRFLQLTSADVDGKQTFADVSLALGVDVIPSHKAVLAARSSYFEAKFRSFPPEEAVPIAIGELVPSKQSFQSLLRFIYYGETDMPPEDSLYLFSASHFYIFANKRLQAFCKHNLERNVNVANVLPILEAADCSQAVDMKRYALNLIVRNYPRVAAQPKLKHLSRELLLDILYALADVAAAPIASADQLADDISHSLHL